MKIEIELTDKERYDIWYINNFQTGKEYNPEFIIDFNNECYVKTPTTTTIILDEYDKEIYNEIENLIIRWNNDGTQTAGVLTRQIMGLLKKG